MDDGGRPDKMMSGGRGVSPATKMGTGPRGSGPSLIVENRLCYRPFLSVRSVPSVVISYGYQIYEGVKELQPDVAALYERLNFSTFGPETVRRTVLHQCGRIPSIPIRKIRAIHG